MAIRKIDGFDHIAMPEDKMFLYPTSYVAGRFGGQAIRVDGSSQAHYLLYELGSGINLTGYGTVLSYNEVIVGFAYRNNGTHAGNRAVIKLTGDYADPELVSLSLLTDGTLHITYGGINLPCTNGPAYGALTANTWYYIEFHVKVSTSVAFGDCQAFVNGVLYQTLNAGQSTVPTGGGPIASIFLSHAVYPGYTYAPGTVDVGRFDDYDDFYLLDVDSATPVPLGDCTVVPLYPNANGATNAWSASGVGSNYAAVNQTFPDDDTTYVSSPTVGAVDLYAIPSLPSTAGTILGVQVNLDAGVVGTGTPTGSIQAAMRVAGTNYYGPTVDLAPAFYGVATSMFQVNPATSAPWTTAALAATQFGLRLVSAS